MRNFIEEKMVQYFKNCSVDKYGQVRVADPYSVFKDKTEEVLNYLKTDRLISVKTYGGQFGAYKGFSLTYDVNDKALRDKCYAILRENKNYRWAMTH